MADGKIEISVELDESSLKKSLESLDATVKKGTDNADKTLSSVLSNVTSLTASIADTIAKEIPKVRETGKNIIDGLWQGMQNSQEWLKKQASALFSDMVQSVKNTLGIHSPSTVFAEIGKFLNEGLALGIQENMDLASSAGTELGNAIVSALKEKYAEAEAEQKAALNREIDAVKSAADEKIAAYEKEHKAKLDFLKESELAEIDVLQAQIDAIDAQTAAENKQEKQRSNLNKLISLNQAVITAKTYEEQIKAQKAYDDELAKQKRESELESRKQQKEDLKQQIADIKDSYNEQKQVLDEQKTADLEEMKADEKALLDSLANQKTALAEHYDELNKAHNLQAEARKLIIEQNNEEIVALLGEYNPYWYEAGKSFGEKLLEGMESTYDSIKNFITEIGGLINGSMEYNGESPAYTTALDKMPQDQKNSLLQSVENSKNDVLPDFLPKQSNTVNNGGVVIEKQEININQKVESPSETARAMKNISKELAYGY